MTTLADRLEAVRALRAAGRERDYIAQVQALAREYPHDVDVRIEAAYGCDALGSEHDALVHYEAAWALGVPEERRQSFLVGYGSTLRNTGRAEHAVAVLGEAVAEFPDYAPLKVFLALALGSLGQPDVALATAIDIILDIARDGDQLDGYQRAILAYRDELLARGMGLVDR